MRAALSRPRHVRFISVLILRGGVCTSATKAVVQVAGAGHDAVDIYDIDSEQSVGVITDLPRVGGPPDCVTGR